MLDDQQLLRHYTADGSEAAFAELVSRHVNLVYSTALRQTGGDAHLAQDIAQQVFISLARKAASLSSRVILAGWLHCATRFVARQILRDEARRRRREQEAAIMNEIGPGHAPDWDRIRPMLDEALSRLSKDDRDALLLRFFEQRSLAEVAQPRAATRTPRANGSAGAGETALAAGSPRRDHGSSSLDGRAIRQRGPRRPERPGRDADQRFAGKRRNGNWNGADFSNTPGTLEYQGRLRIDPRGSNHGRSARECQVQNPVSSFRLRQPGRILKLFPASGWALSS